MADWCVQTWCCTCAVPLVGTIPCTGGEDTYVTNKLISDGPCRLALPLVRGVRPGDSYPFPKPGGNLGMSGVPSLVVCLALLLRHWGAPADVLAGKAWCRRCMCFRDPRIRLCYHSNIASKLADTADRGGDLRREMFARTTLSRVSVAMCKGNAKSFYELESKNWPEFLEGGIDISAL